MKKQFYSTKTYTHSVGLSACFRQWRAKSHCRFLHGYALQVRITFGASKLDLRNWVVNFGSLKPIKQWLEEKLDHKTLVAKDDPQIGLFREMEIAGLIQLVEVESTGCEKFAEMIFDHLVAWVKEYGEQSSEFKPGDIWVESVEVIEHEGNSAICKRK